jgi:predicted RNase H-like nuclease (RuvC/YqgF family)
MYSAARQARVDELENAAELLAVKNRELEDTAEALRKQLGENAQLSQRVADLQALNEHLNRQLAGQRPLLDVIEATVQQLKGQT